MTYKKAAKESVKKVIQTESPKVDSSLKTSAPAAKKTNKVLRSKVSPIAAGAKETLKGGVSKKGSSQKALPDLPLKTIPKADPKLEQRLAKKPAGSLQSSLRLFQIYYESWQRELLDPNFAALDNSKSKSELLEFAVFEQLSKSDYVKGAELWGALSWRFTEKTGMTGAELVKNIVANPGFDIYYCDPYPHNEALFHNLWLQGEISHPQFLALCQSVFQAAGISADELISINPSADFSAANYFIGTPKFWGEYLPWVTNILSLANKKLPPKVRDMMHSKVADDRGLHNGASYVPFIVERLFPIFMRTTGKNLKGYKIALPEREREMNVHLKLLREMKDVAHKTKSAWLAACWVNYRNLYLTQTNPKDWCNKYLRNITPTDIKFSSSN